MDMKYKDVRHLPTYSVFEAAHYLKMPVSTIRSWVVGQPNFKRLITLAEYNPPTLSFINLVEAYVLASMRRKHRIHMPRVRKALKFVKEKYHSNHPLAELQFETDGLSLFVREFNVLVNVSQAGQIAMMNVLRSYLKRIERDESGLAKRLYPFTRKGDPEEPKYVVIDPEISFGRPVLVNTGIPVAVIVERYLAGESTKQLTLDYGRTQEEIEEALRCELWQKAA